jgi:hypothetical protein
MEFSLFYKHGFLILIFLLPIVFASGTSFADREAERRKKNQFGWHVCTKDSDCVFVGNSCFSASVNKRYKSRLESFSRSAYEDNQCFPIEDIDKPEVYCKRPTMPCRTQKEQKEKIVCFAQKGLCNSRF